MRYISILVVACMVFMNFTSDGKLEKEYHEPMAGEIGPILIEGNDDLENEAAVRGWPGNGSDGNPYIIDGLNINANGSGYGLAITTDHSFIIQNCSVRGATGGGIPLGGICIMEGNGTIRDCRVNDSGYGIRVLSTCVISENIVFDCTNGLWLIADDMEISNNTVFNGTNHGIHYQGQGSSLTGNSISNFDFGILLYNSFDNELRDNHMTDIDDHGIRLDGCDSNTLISNYAARNDDGIFLNYGSDHNTMIRNIVLDCEEGIYIKEGQNNSCFQNEMFGCSFVLGDDHETFGSQRIFINNTVNGLAAWYMVNGEYDNDTFREQAGQLLVSGASNMTVSGVRTSNGSVGMVFLYSNDILINGCNSSGHVYQGIRALECSNFTVKDLVSNGCDQGMDIDGCRSFRLTGSHLSRNRIGVSMFESSDVDIHGSSIRDSDNGIKVWYDCKDISLRECNISLVTLSGITAMSRGVDILSNSISNGRNGSTGIETDSDGCSILDNTISGLDTGIRVTGSDSTVAGGNSVVSCSRGIILANSASDLVIENKIDSVGMAIGIGAEYCRDGRIVGNSIQGDGGTGISLFMSDRLSVFENELEQCFIDMDIHTTPPGHSIPTNNTIDGRQVIYHEDAYVGEIDIPVNGGQYIFAMCQGGPVKNISITTEVLGLLAVRSGSLLLSNLSFAGNGTGMYLKNCDSCVIEGSFFEDLEYGIKTYDSGGITYRGCQFQDIVEHGILIMSSRDCRIVSSLFKRTALGVGILNSRGCDIEGCMFREGGTGILSDGRSELSAIEGCGFLENHGLGLHLNNSYNNEITENAFVNNGRYISGRPQLSFENDDNTLVRNYYFDHTGPDNDSNGFVDIPYVSSSGPATVEDPKPRTHVPYHILGSPTHPDSLQYLDEIVISWKEPTRNLLANGILGYIVRRLPDDMVRPSSWHVREGFELIDQKPGNSTRIGYTIQVVSEIGDSYPVHLVADLNRTRPVVDLNLHDGAILNNRTVDLSYFTDLREEEMVSRRLYLNGEMISPVNGSLPDEIELDREGVHTAEIFIRDRRGYNATDSVSFILDLTSPHARLDVGERWTNDITVLGFEYHDEMGIDKARIMIVNVNNDEEDLDTWWGGLNGSGDIPQDLIVKEIGLEHEEGNISMDLPEGRFIAVLEVVDQAGNTVERMDWFGVDRTPPMVISSYPHGIDVSVETAINITLSESGLNVTGGLNGWGHWERSGNGSYVFVSSGKLEYFRDHRIIFQCKDRGGNQLLHNISFRTEKDPEWVTSVIFRIISSNGSPIEGANITISGKWDLTTDRNGFVEGSLWMGNDTYSMTVRKEGYRTATFNFTVPYGNKLLDLKTLELERSDDNGEDEKGPPYLTFALGALLIMAAIYFAVTAFTRKGGPLEE